MPAEVRHFSRVIPANTPQSAPVTIGLVMPPRVVRWVHWRVPRGPLGTMGWLLAMGKVAVLPLPAGIYVVADGESGTWDLTGQPDSGDWQIQGYNTGANPHSVHLAFGVDLPARPAQLGKLLHPYELAEVPDLSAAGRPVIRPL